MPVSPNPVIFIVDDEPDVRNSVQLLLGSVGLSAETFGSAQEFLNTYDPTQPGCLLLDVRMPGMSGPDLQETLRTKQINIPVIIMTGHGDVPTAVRTMKAGAIDVLEKPFNDQVLLDRVQQALQQDLQQRQAEEEREEIAARLALLTPREIEVMTGVVQGKLNKIIADDLHLSTRTVEIHRAHIMDKMQTRSLSQLVKMVMLVQADRPDL